MQLQRLRVLSIGEETRMSEASKNKLADDLACAIYTRKSHEEGLQQEFNLLDSLRECGRETTSPAQSARRLRALPNRYDDGGFSGSNLKRPAMARLVGRHREPATMGGGRRLQSLTGHSRSLLDFSRIMGTFR